MDAISTAIAEIKASTVRSCKAASKSYIYLPDDTLRPTWAIVYTILATSTTYTCALHRQHGQAGDPVAAVPGFTGAAELRSC